MPLFDFLCKKCETVSEILVRADEKPACPKCGSSRLVKQTSAFAPVDAAPGAEAPPPCASPSCSMMQGGSCPLH